MSGKISKKHNSLCISTKIEIIQRLRKGETISDLSRIYNIPRTTICTFKNNGDQMEDFIRKMDTSDGIASKRKRLKRATNTLLDEIMYHWYLQQKSFGLPVNGPMIVQKALTVNQQLKGDPNFKASSGWLDKFKCRHGIRFGTTDNDNSSSTSSGDKKEIEVKVEMENDDYETENSPNSTKSVQNLKKESNGNNTNGNSEDLLKKNDNLEKSARLSETKDAETKNNKEVSLLASIITHKEAEVMLGKCIEWYEMQEESRASEIMLLKEIRSVAEAKSKLFLNSFT